MHLGNKRKQAAKRKAETVQKLDVQRERSGAHGDHPIHRPLSPPPSLPTVPFTTSSPACRWWNLSTSPAGAPVSCDAEEMERVAEVEQLLL